MGTASSFQAASSNGSVPQGVSLFDDWYVVSLPAQTRMRVTLLQASLAATLDLFVLSADASSILGTDQNYGGAQVVLPAFPAATDVLILVHGSGGPMEYKVGVSPVPANDACSGALVLQSGQTVTGNTTGLGNDTQMTMANSCTGYANSGADTYHRVTIPAGQTLTATLETLTDHAMYLLDSCTGACCWAGVDDSATDSEVLSYTNATGATQELLLVVDSFDATSGGENVAGPYELGITIQ
jgi:hypothetical protein